MFLVSLRDEDHADLTCFYKKEERERIRKELGEDENSSERERVEEKKEKDKRGVKEQEDEGDEERSGAQRFSHLSMANSM